MTATPSQPVSGSAPATLRNEERLRLLIDTGLLLASERSLDVITQATVDAGRRLCDAQFGAFFYTQTDEDGGSHQVCKTTGLNAEASHAIAPIVELREFFDTRQLRAVIQRGHGIVRVDDVTQDQPLPFTGFPSTRSYLAVPVRSRDGDLVGALAYGHADANIFVSQCEDFVDTIATQAASAIDNFRLGATLFHEIAIADNARTLQRETADRLRQALDAAQMGTWSWNRETDLLDLDDRAAQLFGVRPGERITRTELRERIVIPEDLSHTKDRLQQSIETAGNYCAEYRIENPRGETTWVSSTGILNFASGMTEVTGMVGTAQDITSRKVHEQTLRESEKLAATGRLAATIAHEINNPLEAITNLIYLSRTDPAVPEPIRQLLETADAELARVSQIAQQTLGFYRNTTRPVNINTSDLLLSIAELFTRKMRSKSVTCTVDLERDFFIFGLQGEIRQVFSNLVVNAIDVSSHSAIHIRSRKICQNGRPGLSVLIQDHGSGIPAPVRDKLFSAFVTTKQSVGTGLGLWVTRGIVEKQGGSIRFRTSTNSPSGTLFRVFLPIRPPT